MTGWQTACFREFLTPNKRPYILKPDEDANLIGMRLYGEGPFHRELKHAMKIRKKSHFVVRAGDVIYNKLFAWKGTFGIITPKLDGMFVSDKFPTYELDDTNVDRDYLRWYFKYPLLWEQARRLSKGSAALSKFTLNPPQFLDLTMPLPQLSVQRKIVTRIEYLASKINGAKEIRKSMKVQMDLLLFSQIDDILQELAAIYKSEPLSTLVDKERGISYGIVQTGLSFEGGVSTLRAGDLQMFRVKTDNVKKVSPEIEASFIRTRLRGSEVLLRIRGGLGEVAVCPDVMVGGNVSREIAVIPVAQNLYPQYVMYIIAAPSSQRFFHKHVRGTSYVGINLKDVRRLPIPLAPLEEQRQIAGHIDCLRAKIEQVQAFQKQTISKIDVLLPSILDKAFKGEL